MMAPPPAWQALNQHHLAIVLAEVRQYLQAYVDQHQPHQGAAPVVPDPLDAPPTSEPDEDAELPSALSYLGKAFGLSTFERQLLVLCAGVELSAGVAQLCAQAQGQDQFTFPTFSLALAVLPEADWHALTPVAPLRRWRLIELVGDSLTQSRLRIDERVLHYLTGVPYLDDRLEGLIHPLNAPKYLLPSHQAIAQRLVKTWVSHPQPVPAPILHLCGHGQEALAIAATACQRMDIGLHQLRAMNIPSTVAEREALARLWEREAVLSQSVLLVNCVDMDRSPLRQTVLPFLETLQTRLIIAGIEPFTVGDRPCVHLEIPPSSLAEQRCLWQQALAPLTTDLNGQLEGLISQFRLSATTIQSVCTEIASQTDAIPAQALPERLWDICRLQTRPQLNELAQPIVPKASWHELVLPERERQMLREMAAQVRQQAKVYDTWAFATRGTHGMGISALFAGPSGTGKTLAAEVLAHELRLDLYRIDLSQVVSKYIGETEKNLRQVFDAAEAGSAILLFDEADSLFGKRSDVKDARDRYANLEVSYLLQRMETYRGLAILTTNLKKSIDPAFLRRLRFMVQFPFPNQEQRLEIWRRIFPPQLPTQALDFQQLAQLNVTGGNIRNIALNAAFLAADEDTPVAMGHLLRAAKTEYSKLEKTLTDTEVRGWV